MILETKKKKKCFSYLGGAAFPGTMRAKQATNKKNMVITKRDIFFSLFGWFRLLFGSKLRLLFIIIVWGLDFQHWIRSRRMLC